MSRWIVNFAFAAILFFPASAACGGTAETTDQHEAPAPQVNFKSDIEPIFQRRCVKCHGTAKQESGLRLDNREDAIQGGTSGTPLLGNSAKDSELFQRIASDDPNYRMPFDAPPLSEKEIDTFRRWIEQGAHWPETANEDSQEAKPMLGWFYTIFNALFDAAEYVTTRYRPLVYGCLIFLVSVFIIERAKRMHAREHHWAAGRARWFFSLCSRRNVMFYFIACVALLASGLWLHIGLLREKIERQDAMIAELTRQPTMPLVGLPTPIRPNHPPRLGGTYYRGNDERKELLFNGGFYRTATLQLELCDRERKPLKVGDRVPSGELFVRLEIARSPHATPSLFRKELIQSVHLSRQYKDHDEIVNLDTPVPFEILDEGQRWAAYYGIGAVPTDGDGELAGTVYVYYGNRDVREVTKGYPHYGIVYDLRFHGRRLLPTSELFMGAIYVPGTRILVPKQGEIPLAEWFDFQPIPEIEGEHTHDPDLLGIPEHEKIIEQIKDEADH